MSEVVPKVPFANWQLPWASNDVLGFDPKHRMRPAKHNRGELLLLSRRAVLVGGLRNFRSFAMTNCPVERRDEHQRISRPIRTRGHSFTRTRIARSG